MTFYLFVASGLVGLALPPCLTQRADSWEPTISFRMTLRLQGKHLTKQPHAAPCTGQVACSTAVLFLEHVTLHVTLAAAPGLGIWSSLGCTCKFLFSWVMLLLAPNPFQTECPL